VPLVALLALGGCATVLGIDDGQPMGDASAALDSRPSEAGSSSGGSSGGSADGSSGSSSGGLEAGNGADVHTDTGPVEDAQHVEDATGDSLPPIDAPADTTVVAESGVTDGAIDATGDAADADVSCVTSGCNASLHCCTGVCNSAGDCVSSCKSSGQGCNFLSSAPCCYGMSCQAQIVIIGYQCQ
jgi:hypothetical protein